MLLERAHEAFYQIARKTGSSVNFFLDREDMHIAKIDFPEFFSQAFGGNSGTKEFVACIENIPAQVSPAKIVLHQTARMLWLADRMQECARARPALQILFFMIAAEAVAKLVVGYNGEGASRKHVNIFFKEICSEQHRARLDRAFSHRLASSFIGWQEAVGFLYDIRCDVVHRGQYFSYSLQNEPGGLNMLTPSGQGHLIANISAVELRTIILEGSVNAALRLCPPDSECANLLRTSTKTGSS